VIIYTAIRKGFTPEITSISTIIITTSMRLLLDERLSALDKSLRVDMQIELKRIQREVGITTIFVTHDQEEALSLSDRIGVLKDGRMVLCVNWRQRSV